VGKALNIGLKEWLKMNDFPYCIITAHDPIFCSINCIEMLIKAMNSNRRIGMASPVYKGENSILAYSPIWGIRKKQVQSRNFDEVEVSELIHQTMTIYRKECIKDIGLYDERFFVYGEEYDLPLRAFFKKWKPSLVWGAEIINPGCASPRPAVAYLLARNSLLLAEKHGGRGHAFLRGILLLLNSIRLFIMNRQRNSQIGRIIGVFHYFRRKFGKPEEYIWKIGRQQNN
jgi:GT2 family glycosyltransferase